jgi:hypothetical protein
VRCKLAYSPAATVDQQRGKTPMSKTRSTTRTAHFHRAGVGKSSLSHQIGRIVFESLMRAGDSDRDEGTRLTVERAATPTAPAHMAKLYPGDASARARVLAMYENCLRTYRDEVRPQDTAIGIDDAGAALACFVAACLFALHGNAVTQETLQRLERQLIGVARLNSTWQATATGARQHYFETMAILGVLLVGSVEHARSQGPAAVAEMKNTARGYLVELLGIEPDLLVLDSDGLSLRMQAPAVHGIV